MSGALVAGALVSGVVVAAEVSGVVAGAAVVVTSAPFELSELHAARTSARQVAIGMYFERVVVMCASYRFYGAGFSSAVQAISDRRVRR